MSKSLSRLKEGKHYTFREISFWAANGLIIFVDERFPPEDDRSHDVLTVAEFLQNLRGINAALGRFKYADERIEHDRLVEHGIKCAKEAKAQGRPDDPEAVRHFLLHRRKSWSFGTNRTDGRPSKIVTHVSEAAGTIENLLLPPIPNHPATLAIQQSQRSIATR